MSKNKFIYLILCALFLALLLFIFRCFIISCDPDQPVPNVLNVTSNNFSSSFGKLNSISDNYKNHCVSSIDENILHELGNRDFLLIPTGVISAKEVRTVGKQISLISGDDDLILIENIDDSNDGDEIKFRMNFNNTEYIGNITTNIDRIFGEFVETASSADQDNENTNVVKIFPISSKFPECSSKSGTSHILIWSKVPKRNWEYESGKEQSNASLSKEWVCKRDSSQIGRTDIFISRIPHQITDYGLKYRLIVLKPCYQNEASCFFKNFDGQQIPGKELGMDLFLSPKTDHLISDFTNEDYFQKTLSSILQLSNIKSSLFCQGGKLAPDYPSLNLFGNSTSGNLCSDTSIKSIEIFFADYDRLRFLNGTQGCDVDEVCTEDIEYSQNITNLIQQEFREQFPPATNQREIVVNVFVQGLSNDKLGKENDPPLGIAAEIGFDIKGNWVLIDPDRAIPVVMAHEAGHIFGGEHAFDKINKTPKSDTFGPAYLKDGDTVWGTVGNSPSNLQIAAPFSPEPKNFIVLPGFSETNLVCKKNDKTVQFCSNDQIGNTGINCKGAEYHLRGIARALDIEKPPKASQTQVNYATVDLRLIDGFIDSDIEVVLKNSMASNQCQWIENLPEDAIHFLDGMNFGIGQTTANLIEDFALDYDPNTESLLIIGSASSDGTPFEVNMDIAKKRAQSFATTNLAPWLNSEEEEIRICLGEDLKLPRLPQKFESKNKEILVLEKERTFAAAYKYKNQ